MNEYLLLYCLAVIWNGYTHIHLSAHSPVHFLFQGLDRASKALKNEGQQLEERKRQIENKTTKLRVIEEKDTLVKDTNAKLEKMTKEPQERERALLKLKDTQIQEAWIQVTEANTEEISNK